MQQEHPTLTQAQSPAATTKSQSSPTTTPRPAPNTPRSSPTSDCLSQPGEVESLSLPANGLFHSQIDFTVYLPPCYHKHSGEPYPLLILFHGAFYENDQWIRLGALSTADQLIMQGEAAPFVILLPYDPSPYQPSETGFDEAIIEVVLPYLDQHYHLQAEREFRAVGGVSRGAGWAIHFGLTHPDLFGAVGAHSPVILVEDGPLVEGWLAALASTSAPYFYLDIGDRDRDIESALWFEYQLTEYNIYHEWHMYTGLHGEGYWSSHIEEYMRWYAQLWQGSSASSP